MTVLPESNLPEIIGWSAVPAEHRIILTRRYKDLIKMVRNGVRLSPDEQAQFELLSTFIAGNDLSLGTIEGLLTIQFMDREQDAAEVDQDADDAERLDDSVRMFGAEMQAMRAAYRSAYAYILDPYHIPVPSPHIEDVE